MVCQKTKTNKKYLQLPNPSHPILQGFRSDPAFHRKIADAYGERTRIENSMPVGDDDSNEAVEMFKTTHENDVQDDVEVW